MCVEIISVWENPPCFFQLNLLEKAPFRRSAGEDPAVGEEGGS